MRNVKIRRVLTEYFKRNGDTAFYTLKEYLNDKFRNGVTPNQLCQILGRTPEFERKSDHYHHYGRSANDWSLQGVWGLKNP